MIVGIDGLEELRRRLAAISDTRGILGEIQIAAVAEAKKIVPRKTTHLGRSIIPGSLSDAFAIVQAHATYAAFVEFGTKAHDIRPRNKKALAWPTTAAGRRLSGRARKGADMRFAKRVRHPGTKPQPFLVPGAREGIRKVGAKYITDRWDDAA